MKVKPIAEIENALRIVSAEDIVAHLENGLDTDVGENGSLLSTGEKQLIAFARAIIADPAILILDEATSALDNTTEVLIQEALNELCQGRTTLVVAHRLSTIRGADEIAVVTEGRITERGTHEELMAKGGTYRDLYALQFRDNDMFE